MHTDTGVVHEDLQAAVRRDGAIHRGATGLRAEEVAGVDLGPTAGGADLVRGRFELGAGARNERHRCALVAEGERDGAADSAARTGDECRCSSRIHGTKYILV
jgi:hypothetical protein